jgi:hypothetical protein
LQTVKKNNHAVHNAIILVGFGDLIDLNHVELQLQEQHGRTMGTTSNVNNSIISKEQV